MSCSRARIEQYCQGTKKKRSRSKQIKDLAKRCQVPYKGWLFQLGADDLTCMRLITIKGESLDYIPVSSQLNSFLSQFLDTNIKDSKETLYNFTGFPEAGIYSIMYLNTHYPDLCPLIPDTDALIQFLLSKTDVNLEDFDIPWSHIGLHWRGLEGIEDFRMVDFDRKSYIKQAQACTERFVISLLTLDTDVSMHANIILYDREMHILERFDPYEIYTEYIDQDRLDRFLEDLFLSIDPDFHDFYSPPKLEIRLDTLQLEQLREGEQVAELDPDGFCQPWTFLYMHIRLSFPMQDPLTIPKLLKEWARSNNTSLTNFIRHYSHFLLQQSEVIFSDVLSQVETAYDFQDRRIFVLAKTLERLPQ